MGRQLLKGMLRFGATVALIIAPFILIASTQETVIVPTASDSGTSACSAQLGDARIASVPARAADKPAATYFVAPNGNDHWSGALAVPNSNRTDGPFATLTHARDAIRQRKTMDGLPRGGIAIELRGGVYELDAGFSLTEQDSGALDAPVVYRAYRGEYVRLIGGRRLPVDQFQPVHDNSILRRFDPLARGVVRQIDLRALGITDFGKLRDRNLGWYAISALEVFFNTKPLTLARWPDAGTWAFVGGEVGIEQHGSFSYTGDRPSHWQSSGDVWVHGYFANDYGDRYERIATLDSTSRTITTTAASADWAKYLSGQRFYFLNILEELDAPGEWYLDRDSGILYLWPPDDLDRNEIYVSLLEQPIIEMQDVAHTRLIGFTVEGSRAIGIEITGGSDNQILGVTIRNTGTDGIRISGKNNGIVSSDIYDTGDGGVRLSGGDQSRLIAAGNYAINNHIHHFGRFVHTYRPAVDIEGVGQRVAHNLIHDAPSIAIAYGGNDHTIALNEIHNVAQETSDVGAIYTYGSWTGRGNLIRNNYIHHIDLSPLTADNTGAQGIYLDNFHSGTAIVGNIFYRTGKRGVFINSGPLNCVENNIFIGTEYGVFLQHITWRDLPPSILQDLEQINYQSPPYATRYPELTTIRAVPTNQLSWPWGNVVRRNIFYRVPTPIYTAPALPINIFVIRDNLMTSDDPGFIDATHENWQLRSDASIFQQTGFQPIPFDQIGLYIDAYRYSLP